ncbi:uncharacterized protein LOC112548547 [Alligator sinensis]|uniref:Uncharacterized protein LOC112548547 n=1 Tax=Alligator sinensis TaxID=38654 RepID=A0A3Q0FS04_ALLSI|nr:uncharacterized protein LOC112548547 [Alligator sinensis]
MSSREAIVCGKEENQRKCHISERDGESHIPLAEDKARIAEAAKQSALDILRDAVKKDRVLMEMPQDLISRDSEEPMLWMERYAVLTEQRVRNLISVLEKAKFMGDPSAQQLYAYVYTESGDKTIYLCPLFWEAPSHLDKVSQPGTLIHEASHFLGTCDITYEPFSFYVTCRGVMVKNNSTDPDSPKFLPLVTAVLNANNVEYDFEWTPRHRGGYKRGRCSCCGETARSSICESAVPDELFMCPNNGSKLVRRSIAVVVMERLLVMWDSLKQHIAALRAIPDAIDKLHRTATIANVARGPLGMAAGIAFRVALCLSTVPLMAMLAFSPVGFGGSLAGGVTSAAAMMTYIAQSRVKQEFNWLMDRCEDEVQLTQRYVGLLSIWVQETAEDNIDSDLRLVISQVEAGAGCAVLNPTRMATAANWLECTSCLESFVGSATHTLTFLTLGLHLLSVAKPSTEVLKRTQALLAAKVEEAAAKLEEVIDRVNKMQEMLAE